MNPSQALSILGMDASWAAQGPLAVRGHAGKLLEKVRTDRGDAIARYNKRLTEIEDARNFLIDHLDDVDKPSATPVTQYVVVDKFNVAMWTTMSPGQAMAESKAVESMTTAIHHPTWEELYNVGFRAIKIEYKIKKE